MILLVIQAESPKMGYYATMVEFAKMSPQKLAVVFILISACSENSAPRTSGSQDSHFVKAPDGSSSDEQGIALDALDVTRNNTRQDASFEDLHGDAASDTNGTDKDVSLGADSEGDSIVGNDASEPSDVNMVTDASGGEPDALAMDAEPDVQPPKKLWLLSVDNGKKMLQVVDVETGNATDLCDLAALDSYPSLTFSRLNGLYGSRGGYTLDRINPCTCEILPIGGYGGPTGVFGITADPGDALFGVATTQDVAISIDVVMGEATQLGELGVNFTTSGATYSQEDKKIYAINGGDDELYSINMKTGEASQIASLNYDFGSVGIEVHPANNKLYACSSKAELLEVDPTTGTVTVVGPMNQSGSCTNLAAPWFDVPCISLP